MLKSQIVFCCPRFWLTGFRVCGQLLFPVAGLSAWSILTPLISAQGCYHCFFHPYSISSFHFLSLILCSLYSQHLNSLFLVPGKPDAALERRCIYLKVHSSCSVKVSDLTKGKLHLKIRLAAVAPSETTATSSLWLAALQWGMLLIPSWHRHGVSPTSKSPVTNQLSIHSRLTPAPGSWHSTYLNCILVKVTLKFRRKTGF